MDMSVIQYLQKCRNGHRISQLPWRGSEYFHAATLTGLTTAGGPRFQVELQALGWEGPPEVMWRASACVHAENKITKICISDEALVLSLSPSLHLVYVGVRLAVWLREMVMVPTDSGKWVAGTGEIITDWLLVHRGIYVANALIDAC